MQNTQVLADLDTVTSWTPPALAPSELCAAHLILDLPVTDAVQAACERTGPLRQEKSAAKARPVKVLLLLHSNSGRLLGELRSLLRGPWLVTNRIVCYKYPSYTYDHSLHITLYMDFQVWLLGSRSIGRLRTRQRSPLIEAHLSGAGAMAGAT